jgi:PAT family beta-lactamase induction signal transducer AmpG
MGRAWGAGLLGPLKENMSWEHLFLWIAILPLLMLIFIQFINFIQHKKHIDGFILAQENLALLKATINK